jgi:imidazolonepropionase-like amidohydrolase
VSSVSSVVQIPSTTSTAPVWLHVGTLLDGTSTTPRRDAHVVYNAGEILFVGSDGTTPPREVLRDSQSTPDVSAPDATLLPGLIDAHAHLFLEGGEIDAARRAAYLKQSPADLLAAAHPRMEKLAGLGIAGIRDAGDKDGVGLALSKFVAGVDDPSPASARPAKAPAARHAFPYLDSPGAAIHHAGRYGGFMADAIENHTSLRAVVEARIAAGADRIKLIPTGIINFKKGAVTSEPQMTTVEVTEIVSAARSCSRQTFAHASGDTGIDRAIDGGVDSIEHGFFIRDDQLAKLRDRQIAWVPTFAPVQAQLDHASIVGWDETVVDHLRRILDQHAASLRRAHELGVLIIAGSDAGSYGVPHGIGFLRELELMERAGLPSLAVIIAATGISARRLSYRENIGRIAPGARSRFIVTEHSPLTTVANLRRARHVIFDGQVFCTDEHTDVSNL